MYDRERGRGRWWLHVRRTVATRLAMVDDEGVRVLIWEESQFSYELGFNLGRSTIGDFDAKYAAVVGIIGGDGGFERQFVGGENQGSLEMDASTIVQAGF
ncbi:unnamed protein product [Linum trigynum]|uniref:Uncharacterized protein n=1 Tax=Linum trigynum TaxID=586398 RepID=A0AAV2C7F9_9ROSI